MKKSLALCFLLSMPLVAQQQMPPGTTSPVPTEQQAPPSPDAVALQKAEDSISANKFDEAVTLLTPIATSSQSNGRVFYDLGFAQDALGHDAEAAAAYKAAIAHNGHDAAARVSLGLLMARGSDRSAAEEQLVAAANIESADPALLARANRALSQIHLQDKPERARQELLIALKLSPETPEDTLLAAEIADALQDDEDTEKAYARAVQVMPTNPEAAAGYARVLSRQKKYDEAEAVLRTARKAHPDDSQLLSELASTKILQGHVEEALPLLDRLRQAEPNNTAIALLQARAYAASGAGDKADALYKSLIAATPNDPVLLAEAGDNLIREKRSPEAEPLLQRALAHQDRFPSKKALGDAAGELAFAASANHDPETVLKALAIRDTISAPEAPYTFLSATAHDTLRHTKQAADQYRLFLQQSGGKLPDQEWQAQQRLRILERTR